MTSRGLSAWSAVAFALLAILVAVDRPHWFGLQPGAAHVAAPAGPGAQQATATRDRSAPWLIRPARAATR
ncbi:hypothetical protein J2Y58_003915 [Sphingomonas sp. BE138]|uniref:hypothetical protein n=1 Tax=Sphingomonas sp. BE138 TaxID=2817845 RepID=UPI0028641CE2|nr:hypothetical protein [Sphingomonas sp. BE138]MDR6790532.1 hypothetical protein [Sphingomonas sp. BE138]